MNYQKQRGVVGDLEVQESKEIIKVSRILHLESIGGASGDMLLGALIGLGVSIEKITDALKNLKVDPFEIVADQVVIQGMSGIQARVILKESNHEHTHDDHHGRHLSTILKLINDSDLAEIVKNEASAVFQRIGEAEAAIHNIDIEKIHFHEVGAMDSIVDIIGCCVAKNELDLDEVVIRSLPFGHGTIQCEHGVYPNPAPATVRILEGFPIEAVDEPFELVTPTGAALISQWRTGSCPPAEAQSVKSVYSFGQRTLSNRPNLLRATIYENASDQTSTSCDIIECNLDDMTPELIGVLTERLFEKKALDVTTQSIMMKKQRPGVLLQVLCESNNRKVLTDLIFKESTTFGVRYYRIDRDILKRSFEDVDTVYGKVRIKVGYRNNELSSASPEMDDCIKISEETGKSVEVIYRAALVAWEGRSRK